MQEKGPVQRSFSEGGFAHLILIFVVLIFLAIGGYFVYTKFLVPPSGVTVPVNQTVETTLLKKPTAITTTTTTATDSSSYTNPFSSDSADVSDSEYLNPFDNI